LLRYLYAPEVRNYFVRGPGDRRRGCIPNSIPHCHLKPSPTTASQRLVGLRVRALPDVPLHQRVTASVGCPISPKLRLVALLPPPRHRAKTGGDLFAALDHFGRLAESEFPAMRSISERA